MCEACDNAGSVGTCGPVQSGPVHGNRMACNGGGTACAGSCMGLASGLCSYPTFSCGAVSCSGTQIVPTGTCNGNGSCAVPAAQNCSGGYICSANACKTSCTADADCVSGYFCAGGTCHRAAIAVSAAEEHTCALVSDGTVQCWGNNAYGDLGNGTFSSGGTPTPGPVTGLSKPATAICGTGLSSCALLSDGTVWCWGWNYYGGLGNGSFTTTGNLGIATPVQVQGLPSAASSIACGYFHVCAIVSGALYCWGYGEAGQLGNGMFLSSSPNGVAMATPVTNMGSSVTAVTAGSDQTCAIKSGTLYCWGDNTYGEVGTGTLGNQYATPQVVSLTNPGVVNAVSAAGYHTCLLYAGGTVLCWGMNNSGELGQGFFTSSAPYGTGTAAAVVGSVSGIAIELGDSHSCALNGNSTISCWGNDTSGQLGNGSIVSPGIDMAVAVTGLPLAPTAVSAGGFQTCALLKNGSVYCWGSNSSGELGNGNEAQSSAPTQVLGW